MYFVYMLKTTDLSKDKTYVDYTKNLKKRLRKHNSNKCAKATKGCNWEIIFKKKFQDKRKAMSYEYKLKKDRKQRSFILKRYLDI